MNIIAFTGLKGSGKDTAASVFVERNFEHVKMADGLKSMLRAMLAYQGVSHMMIERMIDGDLKEVPSEALGGRTPRHAMQTLGTEWGRELMKASLWVDIAAARCAMFGQVVISDVRFPNEVKMVRDLGGRVYRVDRGLPVDDMHASERLVLDLEVDAVIPNEFPTAEAFQQHIRDIFIPA